MSKDHIKDNPKFTIPTPEEWVAQCKELEDTFLEKEGMSRKEYFEKMFLGVWETDLDDSSYFKGVIMNPDVEVLDHTLTDSEKREKIRFNKGDAV